jgi:drug/metabolite transporter (DMT)-like permease
VESRPWTTTTRLLFLLIVLAWGLNYPFVNVGLRSSGPIWLAALRAGVGLAGMLVLVTAYRAWGTLDAAGRRDALLLGLPNTALFFGLWFVAAEHVLPGTASVVVYTFPLWVAVLSAPVMGIRLTLAAWASVAAGFVGVALVAQFWMLGSGGVSPLPIAELLLAAVSWAMGTVLFQRRFSPREILSASAYQLTGGFAALLAAAVGVESLRPPAPTVDLGVSLLWMGLVGTAVAYAIWFTLLGRTPAAQVSAYLFLVPVVALAASAVVFGERLGWVQVGGVALVLVAIYGIGRSRFGGERVSGRSRTRPGQN